MSRKVYARVTEQQIRERVLDLVEKHSPDCGAEHPNVLRFSDKSYTVFPSGPRTWKYTFQDVEIGLMDEDGRYLRDRLIEIYGLPE